MMITHFYLESRKKTCKKRIMTRAENLNPRARRPQQGELFPSGWRKKRPLENVCRGNYNRFDGVCCERLTVQ